MPKILALAAVLIVLQFASAEPSVSTDGGAAVAASGALLRNAISKPRIKTRMLSPMDCCTASMPDVCNNP